MKILRILTLLFSLLFVLACKKSDSESGLNGEWKLTETLADPGDGSGKWISIKKTGKYVDFKSDGTLSGNYFTSFNQFRVIDSQTLEFTLQDGTQTVRYYKLSPGSLEIMGACIEACGSRFRR